MFAQLLVVHEAAFSWQRERYSLAVLNVVVDEMQFGRPEMTSLTKRLTSELDESGYFFTMAQGIMETTLISRGMNPDGCSTLDCAVSAGKNLGVQLVVSWSVVRSADGFQVEANLVHMGSQVVVKSVRETVTGGFSNLEANMGYIADLLMGRKGARKVDRSTKAVPPATRAAPRPRPATQPSYGSGGGGLNWTYVGLGALVAGGVGVGVMLLQGDSSGDNGSTPGTGATGKLPGPPTFP
jgi:hypothetical protein